MFGAAICAALFAVFIRVFNKEFYFTVADDSETFIRITNYIMWTSLIAGPIILVIIDFKLFPLSIIPIAVNYLLFSILIWNKARRKIREVYLNGGR